MIKELDTIFQSGNYVTVVDSSIITPRICSGLCNRLAQSGLYNLHRLPDEIFQRGRERVQTLQEIISQRTAVIPQQVAESIRNYLEVLKKRGEYIVAEISFRKDRKEAMHKDGRVADFFSYLRTLAELKRTVCQRDVRDPSHSLNPDLTLSTTDPDYRKEFAHNESTLQRIIEKDEFFVRRRGTLPQQKRPCPSKVHVFSVARALAQKGFSIAILESDKDLKHLALSAETEESTISPVRDYEDRAHTVSFPSGASLILYHPETAKPANYAPYRNRTTHLLF